MPQESTSRPSMLMVEEYFDHEDDRFLEALRGVDEWRALAGFAGRWKKDHRPWARQQVLRYLEQPLSCIGHQPVVKQLFKQAEENRDDELLAAFLVAFDRLVRYRRRTRWQYDFETRQSWKEEVLHLPDNATVLDRKRTVRDPFSGRTFEMNVSSSPEDRLFRHRTRFYLRRRAWRYFRRLGFARPQEYCAAVARALPLYQDEDLQTGEAILENWGLIHICFGRSAVLERTPGHIRLREGATFNDLKPQPYFGKLWQTAEAFETLLGLVPQARAQLVRTWCMQLLEAEHADRLGALDVQRLLSLLDHDDEAVVQFAARHFSRSQQLGSLPLDTWFKLLETRNVTALELICRAMAEHVHAERLSLADCVRFACAAPVPVARIGLDWLKQRPIRTDEDRQLLSRCSRARCVATGGELAEWVLSHVGTSQRYEREQALALLDSLNSGCRGAAWQWLMKDGSPGREDAVLWSRLIETPYDDIRLPLVDTLHKRAVNTGLSADALTPVWSAVLAGVHRGGRQKLKAIEQIKSAILDSPQRLETLLPVLTVAVRSVRGPEMAAALSAVVELATRRPEIELALAQALPELKFVQEPAP
jgi:hypothetical protein